MELCEDSSADEFQRGLGQEQSDRVNKMLEPHQSLKLADCEDVGFRVLGLCDQTDRAAKSCSLGINFTFRSCWSPFCTRSVSTNLRPTLSSSLRCHELIFVVSSQRLLPWPEKPFIFMVQATTYMDP